MKYKAHLFICTNIKEGKPCCGGAESNLLHAQLKERFKTEAQNKVLRINKSGCLDRCSEGVVAVLYPSGKWLTNLKAADVDQVAALIQSEIKSSQSD